MNKTPNLILLSLLSGIFWISCEETLPSRNETPVEVFSTFLTTVDGRTSFTATRDPAAITFPHPPPVRIRLGLININDETLQGISGFINGSIDIWISDDINLAGKTYVLSENSEFPPTGVLSLIENNVLTIDPGDTFYIEISWPHEVEETTKIWNYLGMVNGSSRTVIINVLAKIQLFSELPLIVSEILQLHISYIKNS